MMKVDLNGNDYTVEEGYDLESFLSEHYSSFNGMAVALNDTVVPRDHWDKTILEDGAKLLVITAAQGG